jgi:hypothetical protein
MTVRSPLYLETPSDIQVVSQLMLDAMISQAVYAYSLDPSVTLSVVASGGNLGTITDTRYQAGNSVLRETGGFASEAATPNISQIDISYSRINQTVSSLTIPSSGPKSFPVYLASNDDIQAMTLQDFYDTFIFPAITALTSSSSGTNQAGTYFISSAASVSGSTRVSATPVFTDTRADASQYTAAGITEQLDQPITITNYYLYRINGVDASSLPSTNFKKLLYIGANSRVLREYSVVEFNNLVSSWLRYATVNETGNRIRYSFTSGENRGSGMTDTYLSGSSASGYNTTQDPTGYYLSQEFPNGPTAVRNVYYLKIQKT